MALKEELKERVQEIFRQQWEKRNGNVVPDPADLKLSNDAVLLDGVVLYADLDQSTSMVDALKPHYSAEIYKAYLHCCGQIIRNEGGEITAYDGDRVMAVFVGDAKNSSAARCALKINYAVREIINPSIQRQYPQSPYAIKQVVGIDASPLWVAKTGVRGDNDLVWVGRAANYAAKLTTLGPDYPTWITGEVFNNLNKESKYGSDGRLMWEERSWTAMNNHSIYRSNWWWPIS